jgi:hypothetical protein
MFLIYRPSKRKGTAPKDFASVLDWAVGPLFDQTSLDVDVKVFLSVINM